MPRGGRGGRNPRDLPRPQQVSRKVSWLLRHGAGQEGLKLGKGGFVNVRDALNTNALKTLKITFPELRAVVAENDKQRFTMLLASSLDKKSDATSLTTENLEGEALETIRESDDPADYVIRANQGHSIKVDTEGLLKPITEEAGNVPETVVHGTDEAAWKLILKSGGLRRMGRNHIHFASGLPAGFKSPHSSTGTPQEKVSQPVISGMRNSSTILIFIDIHAALASGIEFFVSDNGVILTAGNEKGFLPYAFFKRVENRKDGGRVLMEGGVAPEGTVVDVEEWEKEVVDKGRGERGRGGRGGRGGRRSGKAKVVDDSRDLLAGI
ncbi:KptA family-domain-containing protein [Massariosphaeria phaeospora]|uniref:2'-phosphotransferase n=1 Tax=Massariosphaeria phaeospora TaxID=100035 RepID=A0A7C8IFD6_9PLEO|nr:KptA family-domain-containing protein [Massariosphaeria phaeospora]